LYIPAQGCFAFLMIVHLGDPTHRGGRERAQRAAGDRIHSDLLFAQLGGQISGGVLQRGFGDSETLEARIARLDAEREALLAQVPEDWTALEAAYGQITSADRRARGLYRRTVDQAYEPVAELIDVIATADRLAALEGQIDALIADAPGMDRETADARFKEVERALGDVAGANDMRGLLADARREIDDRSPDIERATAYLAEARALFESEVAWRARAQDELLAGLRQYRAAISGTIGLRQQPRLPREQALFVASCNAEHRDISLNF